MASHLKSKFGFYKDNALVNQDYIKDGLMNVVDYVKSVDANLTVTEFKRAAFSSKKDGFS